MASGEESIAVEDARRGIAGGEAQALDIRDEEQWREGHVNGAIHLPRERLSDELDKLDTESRLIVFAEDDRSAGDVVETLRERGFDAVVAEGGMKAWVKEDYRTQPTADPDEETELGGG